MARRCLFFLAASLSIAGCDATLEPDRDSGSGDSGSGDSGSGDSGSRDSGSGDSGSGDSGASGCAAAAECTGAVVQRRDVVGRCVTYEETRTCDAASCAFGAWTGADPSQLCSIGGADYCSGETLTRACDGAGNVVTDVCDGPSGAFVPLSTLYGCTTSSEPAAGTRVCPGATFTRSCWPISGGRARVDWRCDGSTTPTGFVFTQIDEDYCTASSGPEAGMHFCPGEVILRNSCGGAGGRDYYICPESVETGGGFVFEVSLGCGIEALEWEPIHRGVDLRRWTSGGNRFRAVRIDMCDASLRIAATESGERGQRTSAWGTNENMLAAINAGFFVFSGYRPDACVAFGGGAEWPDSGDSGVRSFIAFGRGQTWISEAPTVELPPYPAFPWMEEAVCGDATLVRGGAPQITGATSGDARTGVGFSADRRTLYFLTVDDGPGLSVNAFAPVLAALGVDYGINLDGGGSTTMWVRGLGLVNQPADGSERTVANHLGVWIEGGTRGYNCPP